jgi:hypothetical protein
VGEIILLQRRRFRIAGTARKTKPQRSHAPPAKPNSTAEHRRRANPGPSWTRLRPYEDSVFEEMDPSSSTTGGEAGGEGSGAANDGAGGVALGADGASRGLVFFVSLIVQNP